MTGSTTDALLDAAEVEFADKGFASGSLRQIMRSAGSDPGAIHYHFGGREALAEAVLDRILAPLNQRRLELLDDAIAHPEDPSSPSLVQLVDAMVRPDIETAHAMHERSPGRSRLLAAIYLRPAEFIEAKVSAEFAPVAEAFAPHLHTALPHVQPDTIAWRVRWCVFGTLGALLAHEPGALGEQPFDLLSELTETLAGALAA